MILVAAMWIHQQQRKLTCLSEVSKVYSPEYDLNMYRGCLAGSCRGHQALLLAPVTISEFHLILKHTVGIA